MRARIQDLEVDLAAAEGARDEFVYHLSPKKPPRPAGSPAPKANADQLRAALKVCHSDFEVLLSMSGWKIGAYQSSNSDVYCC